jgi:hypothetical protein
MLSVNRPLIGIITFFLITVLLSAIGFIYFNSVPLETDENDNTWDDFKKFS